MSAAHTPNSVDPDDQGLRLRLLDRPGREALDGGWWPHSRDLIRELTQLAAEFPRERGRILRVLFSRPDWDTAPHRVDLGTRVLKVGSFPHDDTHVLTVQTSVGERLTLLVVPPRFTRGQGEEALLAASTPGNVHTAADLLNEVTNSHDALPEDRWMRAEDGNPVGTVAASA